MCNQLSPGLPKLESVRVNIGITVVRTDGGSVPRSVGHVITQFLGWYIYLPMVLRWDASRAELRYE